MSSDRPARLHLDPACVELRGLALGLRQAWRLRLAADDLGPFLAHIRRCGLAVARSRRRYGAVAGGLLQPEPEGLSLAVVAADARTAERCLRDEEENAARSHALAADLLATLAAHRRLGAAYGYPPCCVQAFCDAHVEQLLGAAPGLSHNALLILRASTRSTGRDLRLAALGDRPGESSPSPLRHLPCRFDCRASQRLAAALLADLEAHNPPLFRRHTQRSSVAFDVLADGSVYPANALEGAAAGRALDARPASRFPLRLSFAGPMLPARGLAEPPVRKDA